MTTPSEVRDCLRPLRSELFELARELVRHPSVTGEEATAQAFLAERWRARGLDVDVWTPDAAELERHPAHCDDGLPVERPVVVARWGGSSRAERGRLILNGHIDVVPAGEASTWSAPPFEGRLDGGRLLGRGACDMKGGLAAMTLAVVAAKELGVVPDRPVFLQSVTGEETGGVGTLAAIQRGYRADAALIAEPTSLALCPVQSGALSFRLRIPGRAAHGALREDGVSAVDKLFTLWPALRELERVRHERFRHPLYEGRGLAAPLSVGRARAGNWPSTVPDEAVIEGRYGVFPGEACSEARRALEETVRAACEEDEWLRVHPARLEWFEGQFEPGETELDTPIVRGLDAAHREMLGREPTHHGVPYGSDLRLFTRYAEIPAVLYGPGDVRVAHAADEHVDLEELVAAAEVLTLLLCRWIPPA